MIVCIAEKPSVARTIAQVLGADHSMNGYMEGGGYQVTWTFGHLCTLKEPQDYTESWKPWSLSALPMFPPRFGIKLIDQSSIVKQFEVIRSLFEKADEIINCGDAGQEGELIQRWVMQKALVRCPVKRLWISSLTEEAIREGFQNLKDASQYDSLYQAGLARSIGDWLLGMNASRLYTLKFARNRQVLSIGRVQTPTLAMIVERQKQIEQFVPKTYWELKTLYKGVTFTAVVRKDDEQLMEEAEKRRQKSPETPVSELLKALEKENEGMDPILSRQEGERLVERLKSLPLQVEKVQKKQGKELPPRLYDLTSLQVDCNKRFGYTADETLRYIQSLYEKKITTYPRVDTTFLSEDVYPKCPAIMRMLSTYYPQITDPLRGKPLAKSKKVFDNSKVTDHHAIIPTGQAPQGLSEQEKRVFDLVARRFIAAFHPECVYAVTTVDARVGEVLMRASGRVIVTPGWRIVYNGEENAPEGDGARNEGSGAQMPVMAKGESGPHEMSLLEKQTQPPRPFTEATLLRAMETAGKNVDDETLRDALKENGIGRPSTRAAIIETLFKRGYIERKKKNLVATPTGVQLIDIIHNELLKSVELTGDWEHKLREIERRTYDAGQFIQELKDMVTGLIQEVLLDNTSHL